MPKPRMQVKKRREIPWQEMDLCSKDEDGQVIFNQYSFCELVKHLLVELVGDLL